MHQPLRPCCKKKFLFEETIDLLKEKRTRSELQKYFELGENYAFHTTGKQGEFTEDVYRVMNTPLILLMQVSYFGAGHPVQFTYMLHPDADVDVRLLKTYALDSSTVQRQALPVEAQISFLGVRRCTPSGLVGQLEGNC